MPRPPARVDSRNTNMSGSVLNSSINTILKEKENHLTATGGYKLN